ncbi:hypothetical protein CYMTET_23060 [Cymbomonas tetramitiformis]|uniref:peptide-methionine (S)-S-oxide reductase n=1 Tax=Cymbomonas tetramitiformis TaxID=36881 RepID=A0AAE0FYP8_9CHLO|nr:hypothetical protein CYMTET_23060 [Cymbomonas tetramitiformis]
MGGGISRLFNTRDSRWKEIECIKGETATFGAGCYWGTEHFFAKHFRESLLATSVGFMGGKGAYKNPTYQEVCTGESGHIEVLQIKFDPVKVSYLDLVKYFFTFHDPTTRNRQDPDVGPQYHSAIFYHSEAQKATAEDVIKRLQQMISKEQLTYHLPHHRYCERHICTTVGKATHFYAAQKEHQQYLERNLISYCSHKKRFIWSSKNQQAFEA